MAKFCFWSSAFTGRPLSTSTLDAAFGVTSIWPSNWPTFRNDPVWLTKFEHQLVLLICSKSSWNISIKHPFFIIIDKLIKSIYFNLTITLFLFMPDQLKLEYNHHQIKRIQPLSFIFGSRPYLAFHEICPLMELLQMVIQMAHYPTHVGNMNFICNTWKYFRLLDFDFVQWRPYQNGNRLLT